MRGDLYMSEQDNQKNSDRTDTNTLSFDPIVIEDIVNRTALEVDGVLAMKVNSTDRAQQLYKENTADSDISGDIGVVLEIDIIVEFGKNIPKINDQIIKSVSEGVLHDTGLRVVAVNVKIADIMKQGDYQQIHLK